MKRLVFNSIFFVFLFVLGNQSSAQNLLFNGDFQSGGNGFGFNLNGAGYSLISAPFTGVTIPGNYAFTTNPQPMNLANFISGGDHTTGTGNMMVIDGNTTGGNQRFWRAGNTGGGVCGLTVGLTYTFSYWVKSVSNTVIDATTQANIGIQFNNVSTFSLQSGSVVVGLPASGWQQVVYTFVPTNACVNIELWNTNVNPVGNDFAVDDFSVTAPLQPLSLAYSVVNTSCTATTDGSIVLYGLDGTAPYVSYSISGPVNATNTTGIFTGLPAGTYSISVTDSTVPAATVTLNGIVISNAPNLVLSAPVTICPGSSTNLSASGGSTYTWTASPADSSLTTPNSATPTVSPTQTTTYTVTSTATTSANLIFNGNFSLGNTGFVSDYEYLAVTSPVGAQTTYGITPNSNTWFPGFSSCLDHTSGTGNMMVVDGSTANGGNNSVWCQTLPVIPGQNYTFSYWVQTVAAANPANLEVLINGASVGIAFAPNTTCNWVQRTYTWNSGANTTAEICIYDRVLTSNGNDFAIDDISFTTPIVCNLSNSVVVTVQNGVAPTITCGAVTASSVVFNWNSVSGATSYTVSYTVNGGAVVSGGSVVATSYTVSGIPNGSSVVITVTPVGTGCFTAGTQTCSNVVGCPAPITSNITLCIGGTSSPLTAITAPGGTLNWYGTNATGGTASPTAPTPSTAALGSTTYYVSQTIGACESVRSPIVVTVSPAGPNLNLFCDSALSTPTSIHFDFNNIGQTSFNYSYSIAGGPWISGTLIQPSHFVVSGLLPGQSVTFNLSVNGIDCVTPQTETCNTPCAATIAPNFAPIAPLCSGSTPPVLATTSPNGIVGTWSPATVSTTANGTYVFTPNATLNPCATTQTLNVSIATPTTPTFTQVAAICSGGTLNALPTTSTNGITGTWSPALNNSGTTTYTFTPAAGQCATTQTMTITVNPNVTPTFTQVSPVCSGGTIPALPTTSTNGISGTWAPALNNIATTTYTFTPSAGQCGTTTTMTIVVNPIITPTFAAVAPICSGGILAPLSTTSTNGITGTWSPALNNTTTTTYTFTPTAGQCASTTSIVITVNPNATPTFTQVAPICSGAIISALPTTSTNGINGTWSPALNNTATTTYTFTPSVGQCATTTTMQIVVFPIAPPTITIQQNCNTNSVIVTDPVGTNYEYSLDGLPYQASPTFLNLSSGNHNIVAHQTSANCFTNPVNFTIINIPNDVVVFNPQPLEVCDSDDNDGINLFDLTQVINFVTGGNPYNVSFHETQTDALVDATFIPTPTAYMNINPWTQTIYIRVESTVTSCFEVVALQLIVHPKPIAVEPTDLHECDNGDAQVGFVVFNLTDKEAEILGGINPATHTVTYYESLADAQGQVNAIGTPTSYTNTVINTQTIWVVVETTATGCVDIVELQLVVDPLPLVNQPACSAYTLCETAAAGVGFEQFNLQTKVDCIVLNQLGMSVTFYPSLLDANNNTNAISNLLYTNVIQFVQTLGIRVTNTSTGCYVVSTMDIRVDPLPVPVAPLTAYEVCDTDQNGLFEFDLNTLSAGILGANPTGNVVTYHETQTDALNGTNIINTTGLYTNILPFMQTLWVAVVNPATGCRGVIPIQLKVNQSPRMPALADLVYCDEDSNNQDASTLVNLAQQTALILAAQTVPPTSNYTVTYYTNLADAQQQVNNIIPTTTYTGTNGQTIWVVVENNTTGCFEIGEFNLIINIPLALTTPPALSLCDDDTLPNNTFTTFDLTVRDLLITQGLAGYTVTYYPSWPITPASVAIANPTAYMNVQPAVQTLGVMVTSPDGCRSYITMDIRVLPIPTPNTTNIPILAPQCEDAQGSGQQFFDITVNENYILNNDPNVTPHYFHSLADATAVPPVNEILNPTLAYIGDPTLATQTPRPVNEVQYIYIAVTSNIFTEYTGQNCYKIVEQPFIINPLPIANAIDDQQICEEDATGNDGFEVFNLPSYNNLILYGNDTTPVSTYVVSFFEDAGLTIPITNPSAYTNLTNPQTIYVSVTTTNTYVDPVTGTTHTTSCTSITDFDIIVNPKPSIAQPAAPLATCDNTDGVNDGYEIYSLASLETEILNGQDPTLFTVTFYESEYNPDATPPLTPTAIIDTVNYPAYTHTFWAAVTNNATGCFKTVSFNIVVEQMPEPFITNDPALNVICVDFTSGAVVRPLTLVSENQTIPYLNEPTTPRPTYTYQWYEDNVAIPGPEGTAGPTYTINNPLNDDQSSIFTLEMTSTSALGCSSVSQDYLVIQSGQATPATGTIGYTVTNAFADNQIITVTVQGYGTYQYSLDDGPRQDSPIFEYVGIGDHIITVWDTEGGLDNSCDPLIMTQVQTIDYPLYFTPNGDGIHDNWNIVGLSGQPTAKIYIFDRHGKLIKQLSSQSPGWDGTYNGQLMPATDYWFTVDFSEQSATRQFRAHFSLKR